MKKFFLIFFCLLIPGSQLLFGDVYVKSKAAGGMGTNETWTSGKKQRMVTHVEMAASMNMPDQIEITRADKGVKWTVNTQLQAYQEFPIPFDYSPDKEKLTPEEQAQYDKFQQDLKKQTEAAQKAAANDPCSKNKQVSEKKSFAGIQAEGYQASCLQAGQPIMTLWLSGPGNALAEKAQKEIEAFEKSVLESQYSKYPPKDKEMTMKLFEMMGTAMGQGLMGMPNPMDLPKNRMMLSMEQAQPQSEAGQLQQIVMLEVLEVKMDRIDPSLFEIPEGFKKVENLADLESQQMVNMFADGNTQFSDLMGGLNQAAEQLGVPEESADESANKPPSPEDIQMMNQMGQGVGQFLRTEMQAQGVWQNGAQPANPQANFQNTSTSTVSSPLVSSPTGSGVSVAAQFPPARPQEAWQQGLYDQSPNQQQNQQIQQPLYPMPQGMNPNTGFPQSNNRQGTGQAPAGGNRVQQATQMLQAGSQIIGQMAQIASNLKSGSIAGLENGLPTNGGNYNGDYSEDESYQDSYQDSYESDDSSYQDEYYQEGNQSSEYTNY